MNFAYIFFWFISDPKSSSKSQALPIIISLVGIVVIVVFAVHLVRVNKKRHVEIADFDFHPTLYTHKSVQERLSLLWNSAKGLLSSRDKYQREHTHPKFSSSTARNYGSIEDADDDILWWNIV